MTNTNNGYFYSQQSVKQKQLLLRPNLYIFDSSASSETSSKNTATTDN